MDPQDAQQQQKGYYNNIFISELGAQRGNESHHPSMYSGALPSPSPSTMSPPNSVIPDVSLNLDLVSQMIGLQGQQTSSIGQGQYNTQLVLEQRLKLNQLQQLQLQNQILQQQVSRIIPAPQRVCIAPTHSSPIFSARIPQWPRDGDVDRGLKRASETSKSFRWSSHTW